MLKITACLAIEAQGKLDLYLSAFREDVLLELRSFFDRLGQLPFTELLSLPFSKCELRNDNMKEILVARIESGATEKMRLKTSPSGEHSIVWFGDGEYWKEVSDKCAALLDRGSGHQYLIVRGYKSQNITLSYHERPLH